MSVQMTKPGYMRRAVIAWCILNGILIATLALVVYVVTPWMERWFVMIPLLVAVIVSEAVIMAETIGPIIRDWIKQDEYVRDGDKPSWLRDN